MALTENTHSTDLERSSSQHWSITDASQTGLDLTGGDFTLGAWIKLEQLPSSAGGGMHIVSKVDGSNGYDVFFRDSDVFRVQFMNGGNVTRADVSSMISSSDVGVWVHIVASVDVSAGGSGISVYKNGSAMTTSVIDSNATSVGDNSIDFVIGKYANGTTNHFDGLIDDVRVWDTELTSAQASTLHSDPCDDTVASANLQGNWLFDNDGTDETANSNDLTNNNSATFSTDSAYECASAPQSNAIFFGCNV